MHMPIDVPPPGDYERLKKFLTLFYEWYVRKPHHSDSSHPGNVLARLEESSKRVAQRGLQMALTDLVEMTSDWTPEQVAAANEGLLAAGAASLSEVRHTYSKQYLRVVKRGRIESEYEYYLVKGVAEGFCIEPGAGEADRIATMLAQYESGAKRTP